MRPVGWPITSLPASQNPTIIAEAVASLESIHATGLVHGNPTLENICFDGETVKFTGFSKAVPCDSAQDFAEEMDSLTTELETLADRMKV